MPSMQERELQKYHHELVKDMRSLVEKYRRAMDWDIPDNDEILADKLIFEALQKALDAIRQQEA